MVMMQQAPPPRSSPLKWIVIGCVGVMMLGGLLIGGCLFAIVKVTAAPVKAGEEFLQAMSGGDAAKAKGLCDPGVPVEELLREPGTWGTGWTVTGRFIETKNGVTLGRVNVALPGKDGKTRAVELQLADKDGWKVVGLKIEATTYGAVAEAPPPEGSPEFRNVDIQKKKIEGGFEVTVNFEVHGLKSEARGANKRIAATHGILLKGPKGQEIKNADFKTIDGEGNAAAATFTDTFTLKGEDANGSWVLHATVRDHLGGATVTRDIEFTLP
ncbi:MAG: hypothetical protein AAB074_12065 [Planctomycetota bacterium]